MNIANARARPWANSKGGVGGPSPVVESNTSTVLT